MSEPRLWTPSVYTELPGNRVGCKACGKIWLGGDDERHDFDCVVLAKERLLVEVSHARARIAELEGALRWARKFATGFDHLRGCPRRNPDSPPCSCGYDTIITPLDEVLVRGRPDE